jgi:hypothetical protein
MATVEIEAKKDPQLVVGEGISARPTIRNRQETAQTIPSGY